MGVVGVFVLMMLTFGGCVSYQKCLDKYGTQTPPTTVAVTDTLQVPVTVTTPADSLAAHFDLDSLARAPDHDTLRLVSAGSRVEVELWKSPATRPGSQQLNARVKVPPQVIHDTVTKVVTVFGKCPPAYTFQPTPQMHWYNRWWAWYQTICTYAFSLLLLLAVVLLTLRLRR